jgi:S1-C subfamily serine protease
MKRVGSILLFFAMVLGTFSPIASANDACSQYKGVTKIWWDGIELKSGQIGRLSVLKDTPLFKLVGEKKVFSRNLKAGEKYRIYAFKPGKLSVGGGFYVDRDAKVSYQTPSKAKLNAVACINGKQSPTTATEKIYSTKEIVELNDEKVVLIQTDIGQGSGIVIGNGLILTNHHVMEGSTEATVKFNNGIEYEVEGIVESDPVKDIAIIKTTNPFKITSVKIRPSSKGLSKGDKVVAIGSPNGLQNTVSEGIISSIRTLEISSKETTNNSTITSIEHVTHIQTNADVDHGSSGGGLFSTNGQLIGITSLGYDSTSANLNFAIATEEFNPLINKYSKVAHSSIKASFPLNDIFAEYFDLNRVNDFEYVLSVMNENFGAIFTEELEFPIYYDYMNREEDGSIYLEAVIDKENYEKYVANYDASEEEYYQWGVIMGQLMDYLYPKETTYTGVWYLEEFESKPTHFPEESIFFENGNWSVSHQFYSIAIEDYIYIDFIK